MRVFIQRVSQARVEIEGRVHGKIQNGFMILLGIGLQDDHSDMDWMIKKIVGMRIFNDEKGIMNLSIQQIEGEILLISQFTLLANTKKGNRPSYIQAAKPNQAIPLYEQFIKKLEEAMGQKVQTGIFGADMKVSLTNDGPVSIWLDSKNKG